MDSSYRSSSRVLLLLLLKIRQLGSKIENNTYESIRNLITLETKTKEISVKLECLNVEFLMLMNIQFVENRVLEDSLAVDHDFSQDVATSQNSAQGEFLSNSRKYAVTYGLGVLKQLYATQQEKARASLPQILGDFGSEEASSMVNGHPRSETCWQESSSPSTLDEVHDGNPEKMEAADTHVYGESSSSTVLLPVNFLGNPPFECRIQENLASPIEEMSSIDELHIRKQSNNNDGLSNQRPRICVSRTVKRLGKPNSGVEKSLDETLNRRALSDIHFGENCTRELHDTSSSSPHNIHVSLKKAKTNTVDIYEKAIHGHFTSENTGPGNNLGAVLNLPKYDLFADDGSEGEGSE